MARPVSGADDAGAEVMTTSAVDVDSLGSAPAVDPPDSSRGRHAAPGATGHRRAWRWVIEIAAVLAVALLVSIGVRSFLATPATISTDAMAPALRAGERVIVSPLPVLTGGTQRGEVIAFTAPTTWVPAADAEPGWRGGVRSTLAVLGLASPPGESLLVLRVVAEQGQRIVCCTPEGGLELDGAPLIEPYLRPGTRTDQIPFDVVVPPGHVFVLGDDRETARDSRYHLAVDGGAVPDSSIIGRVMFVVWPLDRIGPVEIERGSAG